MEISFRNASDALRGDKEFMLQAIDLNESGSVFFSASKELQKDDDLMI